MADRRLCGCGLRPQRLRSDARMPADPVPPALPDLVTAHPDLIARACAALAQTHPGVGPAVAAWQAGDPLAAAQGLVAYWRGVPVPTWLEERTPGRDPIADAERVMDDRTPFFSAWDRVPRRADGGWDWHHNGPHGDQEWGWLHNRHHNLECLFDAWRATDEARYARRIDALLWDWVVANPYPGQRSSSAPWRGLEAFARVMRWSRIVHTLRTTPLLSDATLVAVTASLPDHADYAHRFHAAQGNWLAMEMNGLAMLGCAWREFRDAPAWRAYAATTIAPEVERQCYPDGAQKELTFHYHQVTERNFAGIARTFDTAGFGGLLPATFRTGIMRMWEANAATVDQRGFGPNNNDSDATNIARLLAKQERGDWSHIASAGREGTPPAGPPSRVLPWSGQFTMRSGWGADDQWAFFDVGPWGISHQHNDMLQLSVRHGRDLLIDCGRYHYIRDAWREFFLGTSAHNAVLIDGAGQRPGPLAADAPLPVDDYAITPGWDFCRGRCGSGFIDLPDGIRHTRCVLYRRGRWWLVVDALELDRARELTWLWHLHPRCTPQIDGTALSSVDAGQGNVRVLPLLGPCAGPTLVRGRETPTPLGWYSERYGDKEPTTTGVWTARGGGTVVQAWLITSALGSPPTPASTVECNAQAVHGVIAGERFRLPWQTGRLQFAGS